MYVPFRLNRLFLLVAGIAFLTGGPLSAQLEVDQVRMVDTVSTFYDFFNEEVPLEITLTFDIKKYKREKAKGEYIPVHFHCRINDTLYHEKEMRLKARGNSRKNQCGFAPFWLENQQPSAESEESGDLKRIKIVTHCKDSKTYGEYVLKEYLCYKMYSIISPLSFRVRLVKMTYVDTGRENEVSEGWSFMIEPVEMLAERFNAVEASREGLLSRNMRPVEMNKLALFQYMIGNPDYSVPHGHNVKILCLPGYENEGYTAVPYDFDYSGLVDASYAVPSEYLDISSVRERYYLGPCWPEADMGAAIEQLNLYREEILQLVWDFEYLDQKSKKSVAGYLEEYFEQAEHPNSLIFGIQRTCL